MKRLILSLGLILAGVFAPAFAAPTLSLVYTFPQSAGFFSEGPLVQGDGSNMYGEIVYGCSDIYENCASIIQYNVSTGTVNTLNVTPQFYSSYGGLLYYNGYLYASNNGYVSQINVSTGVNNQITVTGGANGLLVQLNGIIYGTTVSGGANNTGSVYSINPATNAVTVLASFPTPESYQQQGFSGVTSKGGTVLFGDYAFNGPSGLPTIYTFDTATNTLTPSVATTNSEDTAISFTNLDAQLGYWNSISAGSKIKKGPGFYATGYDYLTVNPTGHSNGGVTNISVNGSDTLWSHYFQGGANGDGQNINPGNINFIGNGGIYPGPNSNIALVVTNYGGANNTGTLDEIDQTTNTYNTVLSFPASGITYPVTPPTMGIDGNFYGLTSPSPCNGGCGTGTTQIELYKVSNLPTSLNISSPVVDLINNAGVTMTTTCGSVPASGLVACPGNASGVTVTQLYGVDASGTNTCTLTTTVLVPTFTGTDGVTRRQVQYNQLVSSYTGNPDFGCGSLSQDIDRQGSTYIIDYRSDSNWETNLGFYPNYAPNVHFAKSTRRDVAHH